MAHSPVVDDEEAFEYDVQLTGRPDDLLRERYPHMTVRSTETQTALRRRIEGPEELSALLVEIGTVGLTLTDVHRVVIPEDAEPDAARRGQHPGAACAVGTGIYEVRVVGELGRPLLHHLRCAHYAVQQQTLVRLTLAASELHRFLQACAECGAGLQRVRRVGPPAVAGTG